MAPSGSGKIEFGIPIWYQVGQVSELMFNPESLNTCTSSCMTITSSILQGQYLNIKYEAMPGFCIKGTKITIQCDGFYNPIYQDQWSGFYINIYDNEGPNYKPIEKSDDSNYLDTTSYSPRIIPIKDFLVVPDLVQISTISSWTMNLKPGIPMVQECYIKIYIPDDFQIILESVEANGIFLPQSLQNILSTNDVKLLPGTTIDPRQSILFNGCFQDSSLGLTPQGGIYVSSIMTQKAIKDSNQFDLEIFKDEDQRKLIAKLDNGNIVTTQTLTPGLLADLKIYPLVTTVQLSTLLYINFTSASKLYIGTQVIVQLPNELLLPAFGTQLPVIGLQTASSGSESSVQATYATVLQNNTIVVQDFILHKDRPAPFQFWFAVSDIQNQISAKEAGGFTITTYYKANDKKYYIIDTQSASTSFIATPDIIPSSGEILVDHAMNFYNNANYSIIFQPPSFIPNGGYIQIDFPSEIVFQQNITISVGICADASCKWIQDRKILIKTIADTQQNQNISVVVGGIKNPRTQQPTGSFKITTYDVDGVSLIATGFNINVAMKKAGSITLFKLLRESNMNGEKNTYTFQITTDIPIYQGDVLQFSFPTEITLNAYFSVTQCISTDSIVCGISGQDIKITINSLVNQYGFTWSMSNIANPPSLAPSGGFSNIEFISKEGYLITEFKQNQTAGVTNTFAAQLVSYSLYQESLLSLNQSAYSIVFTPINPLSSTASIQINYPPQIQPSLGNQTMCFVITTTLLDKVCQININTRTIQIKNAFLLSAPYLSQITVKLVNMTNPIDNRLAQGFNITTYSDNQMLFVSDIAVNVMQPQLQCQYPCGSCPSENRQNCTSCWQTSNDVPNFLMSPTSQTIGQCKSQCDFGYTTNGSVDKKCQKCDASCRGCNDNGNVGDVNKCINCSPQFPFRLNGTQLCLSQCNAGIFMMNEMTCGQCDYPCLSCFGNRDTCTSCNQSSSLPNLLQGQCIAICPSGYLSVAGVCQPCISSCKTCSSSPQICDTCFEKPGKDLLFNGKCYDICPYGYVTDFDAKTCIGCLPGCNQCNLQNSTQCFECADQLTLYQGTCRGNCPQGMKSQNKICIYLGAFDLIQMYFPFLITCFVLIAIILLSKLKRKTILVDGKMQKINNQASISVMNSCIAPIQTLVTIAQFCLAIYYGYYIHFFFALAIYLAMIAFNIAYLYWYIQNFYSMHIPKLGTTFIVKNKVMVVTRQNSLSFASYKDPEFRKFYDKHKLSSFLILAMTGCCHFKSAKLLYSRFYMFDMFKARWSRVTYLRNQMIKWQVAYLCVVDLTLIGVSVYGLLTIQWNNQLYMTMLETIAITVLVIILGVIERYQINEILQYTSQDQIESKPAAAMVNFNKKLQLKKINQKVKSTKNMFIERKLEDLLQMFGQKHCMSSIGLKRINFNLEEDDRNVNTWPCSESEEEEIIQMNIKFKSTDAYGQCDNVYTEGVTKPKHKDINIQIGDPRRFEFQIALNRKQNDIMSQSQFEITNEELFKQKTARRRGRKNKYYNAIELEDDDGIEEAGNDDTYVRLIQKQEEEEEELRKTINPNQLSETNARKLRKQLDKANKREEEATNVRIKKVLEDSQLLKQQQIDEENRLMQLEIQRRFLKQEAERELIERKEKEEQELRQQIEQSFQLRRQYEEQERQRIIEVKKEEERIAYEIEVQRLAVIEAERVEREAEVARIEQKRVEEEIIKQNEIKEIKRQQEKVRLEQKEIARKQKEKIRQERIELEQKELLVKQQAEEEIRLKQEFQKARQLQIQQAEIAQRELEKQEQAEQLKLEKELRRQQEEIDRLGRNDQKVAEKEARLLAAASENGQVRKAPYKYTKKVESQQPQQNPISFDAPGDQYVLESEYKSKQYQALSPIPPLISKDFSLRQSQVKSNGTQFSAAQFQTVSKEEDESQKLKTQLVQMPKKLMMRSISINDEEKMNQTVAVNQNAIKNFSKKEALIMVPPMAFLRQFNEYDVLGELDRDDKGNVVILQDRNGLTKDKNRNQVNKQGYLIDPRTGDVIDNMQRQQMFLHKDLGSNGELPAPFNIEKFNFNPHCLMGDFDFRDGKPTVIKSTRGLIDKKGRSVNQQGWYVADDSIVDNNGRKKFDRKQLTGLKQDNIPLLFNFNGKRFDIRDVMGEFEKDQHGQIQLHSTNNGRQLMDSLGRLCNEKGYLIDGQGNIIDQNGRQLWKATDLKSGEFMKIFSFTKFNISRIQGDIDIGPNGKPILEKQPNGSYLDKYFRPVNASGYLIDRFGNVIDIQGKTQFDKIVLEKDGEIPPVFRSGLLRQNSGSSISRLLSDAQNNADQSEIEGSNNNDSNYQKKEGDGDTSVDSKMEDTPANYDLANQRFEPENQRANKINRDYEQNEDYQLDLDQSDFSLNQNNPAVILAPKKIRGGKKKKKPKYSTLEFLEPKQREKNMAGAYGGEAKPEIRRPRVKYDKERLATSKKFRIATSDEPRVRAQLQKLVTANSSQFAQQEAKMQGLMIESKDSKPSKNRKSTIHVQEPNFEEVYGRDIDQFLEDSEWDIDNLGMNQSQSSDDIAHKVTADLKLKAMEKYYSKDSPRRSDPLSQQSKNSGSPGKLNKSISSKKHQLSKQQIGPPRETIINTTDDPGIIHRGELMPFETRL